METKSTTVLIIDDSAMDSFIVKKLILLKYPSVKTTSFENIPLAINFIKNLDFKLLESNQKFVVLLDLHTPPEWTWNFLEIFEQLPVELQQLFDIYLMSSSFDTESVKKVLKRYEIIKDFILKPFHKDCLHTFLGSEAS